MHRLMVYSHDTYGLGNLRRMLSICQALSDAVPELTILLLSGSPMMQSFRMPARLDYIKLPCLTRVEREGYAVRSLGMSLEEAVRLRAELMLSAAANFNPDVFLVDKKPYGIKNELAPALRCLHRRQPRTRQALVLRDILDAPEETTRVWERNRYHAIVEEYYDRILVLGEPEIFDPRIEYRFPKSSAERVRFCGYPRRETSGRAPAEIRSALGVAPGESLVLVTVGGGQDGHGVLRAYLDALGRLSAERPVRSILVSGPEMSAAHREEIRAAAAAHPRATVEEFAEDLIGYLNAADAIVSMGGYNTVCEILSANKPAIVVPRTHPVREQSLRAERMAARGLFRMIAPDRLTPAALAEALREALAANARPPQLAMNGQARIVAEVVELLPQFA